VFQLYRNKLISLCSRKYLELHAVVSPELDIPNNTHLNDFTSKPVHVSRAFNCISYIVVWKLGSSRQRRTMFIIKTRKFINLTRNQLTKQQEGHVSVDTSVLEQPHCNNRQCFEKTHDLERNTE
jgi:hypothetical protein